MLTKTLARTKEYLHLANTCLMNERFSFKDSILTRLELIGRDINEEEVNGGIGNLPVVYMKNSKYTEWKGIWSFAYRTGKNYWKMLEVVMWTLFLQVTIFKRSFHIKTGRSCKRWELYKMRRAAQEMCKEKFWYCSGRAKKGPEELLRTDFCMKRMERERKWKWPFFYSE